MKAVSLFSGCGGSDAGVIAAGFNVVMANDKLAYARDVYLANHPATDYVLGDVTKITTFPDAELLVGCYPCQGFSQGGVRDPGRKINTLYLEFARALQSIRPKAFIVENVSGMVRRPKPSPSRVAPSTKTARWTGASFSPASFSRA